MIQLKTIVPKLGKIEDYLNKPFLDRISHDPFDPFNSTAIGIISDATEIEDGFELTISLWKHEVVTERLVDGQLSAMSFGIKS